MRYFHPLLVYFLLTLAACSSVREHTNYHYTPPEARQAKRCIAQCQQGKNSCEDLCLMKHPQCWKKGGKANIEECKKQCHCTYAFNICYTACGGKVY